MRNSNGGDICRAQIVKEGKGGLLSPQVDGNLFGDLDEYVNSKGFLPSRFSRDAQGSLCRLSSRGKIFKDITVPNALTCSLPVVVVNLTKYRRVTEATEPIETRKPY